MRIDINRKNKEREDSSSKNEPITRFFSFPLSLFLFRTHGLVSNKGTIYLRRRDTIDVKY